MARFDRALSDQASVTISARAQRIEKMAEFALPKNSKITGKGREFKDPAGPGPDQELQNLPLRSRQRRKSAL
jgi:hypothetical protein